MNCARVTSIGVAAVSNVARVRVRGVCSIILDADEPVTVRRTPKSSNCVPQQTKMNRKSIPVSLAELRMEGVAATIVLHKTDPLWVCIHA